MNHFTRQKLGKQGSQTEKESMAKENRLNQIILSF